MVQPESRLKVADNSGAKNNVYKEFWAGPMSSVI